MKSVDQPRIGGDGELLGYTAISFDITESKHAEQALRESEARQAFLVRLDDALRPLADAGAIQNAAARVLGEHLRVSRAMYADVEGEPGAEVGTIRSRYHGDDAEALAPFPERYAYSAFGARVMALRRRGETMVVADVTTDPAFDASERAAWVANGVRAAITVSLVKEGRMVADLGVQSVVPRAWDAQEIALVQATAERTWAAVERARTEAALRQSEARLISLFDALPLGVGIVDADGKLVVSNREMDRYLPNRLICFRDDARAGRWRATHPDGRLVDRADYPGARALRGERVVPGLELRYTQDDGTEMWTQVASVPMQDADGRITGHALAISDIDSLKRAEAALRESEERFRTLADNMDQLAWMADARGAFLWLNKRCYDYTGVTVEEMERSGWMRLIDPDQAVRVAERSRRCLSQGEAWEDVFPLRGRTGEYRWFLGRAVPIKDDEGRLQRWFGTLTDITELEQRNAQVRRLSAHLTAIEQHERSKLAETLHDGLQQLIVAAKLRLPLCLEEHRGEQVKRIDRLLDEAIEIVRSLAWELSPPALGSSTLPDALEWLGDWFEKQHGFHVEVLNAETAPSLPEHARFLLFGGVREMLLNCVKHSGVEAATVEVRTDAQQLYILIADDGAGFDPAKLTYGFGLSSIRERLVALGGRLLIESAPGAGARFTMSLPVGKAQTMQVGLADRSVEIVEGHVRVRVGSVTAHCHKCGCEDFLPGDKKMLTCLRCGASTDRRTLFTQIANTTVQRGNRHVQDVREHLASKSRRRSP